MVYFRKEFLRNLKSGEVKHLAGYQIEVTKKAVHDRL